MENSGKNIKPLATLGQLRMFGPVAVRMQIERLPRFTPTGRVVLFRKREDL